MFFSENELEDVSLSEDLQLDEDVKKSEHNLKRNQQGTTSRLGSADALSVSICIFTIILLAHVRADCAKRANVEAKTSIFTKYKQCKILLTNQQYLKPM